MDINFPKKEKQILKFWQDRRIFEKSIESRKNRPDFIFYEGPPTANGKPGIHHVLSRVFKDVICRYKTMRGFRVLRKAGWDTHGLPVELEIEKKLGIKSKKDIEQFGIAKFNALCRKSVWEYKKDWEKLTERIAFWLEMKNPYITYDTSYIETVWWIIKKVFQKGLIYKDYKVVPYCPRCGTSLSSHEVAQGYKKVKENSIYVKFPVRGERNTFFLVWTTTPWTLPANVALAVGKDIQYKKVHNKQNNEIYILASSLIGKVLQSDDVENISDIGANELVGLQYEPIFDFITPDKKAYFAVAGDFISTEDGTGIVHIAPAFGEDDMKVGKENNLPVLLTVDEEGKFKEEIKSWAGQFVKDADPLIIEDLKNRNLLFKEELYEHDYPFCWRCASPLLYYAKESWFINMQKVKKDLIANNRQINWVPAHLKEGRFGEWIGDVKDWAFSRERYWGTPLPIWQCQSCKKMEVAGSARDLVLQKYSTNNYFLLRHGHSLRQVKKVAMCWPEKIKAPLTPKGIKQAKKAAKGLKEKKIDLIFSSDLLRTKQTAEIAAQETGAKIIFDKRLREYNVGVFNNKDPKLVWDFLNKNSSVITAKLPKGESLVNIAKRTYDFLKDINGKYQGKNILIVSHELPLTMMQGSVEGRPASEILQRRRWQRDSSIKTAEWREIKFSILPYNSDMELDLHRPLIDEVVFNCPYCGGAMKRVPEVIDGWFDSGSMPFAQEHWPFNAENSSKEKRINPPELFPADYISEAVDQTRGWFYTLLAISTLLGFGPPYKNVISLGHVLDEKGEKMSKSRGNVVDPNMIIEKYGADAVRWYFYVVNQPGEPKLFSEKDVESVLKKFIIILWNCQVFFKTYKSGRPSNHLKSKNVLDKWIDSKLNNLVKEITGKLEKYDVTGAARLIESFVLTDLSLWYIRRSRRRLQKPETKKEFEEAAGTLSATLFAISKVVAPFIPFFGEEIYQDQSLKHQSVHLDDWPKTDEKLIDNDLEEKMDEARRIVALALAKRAKAGIKVRQPLSKLMIGNRKLEANNDLLSLIKEEVNVKEVIFNDSLKDSVELDAELTRELKEEGIIRELVRNVQDMRKKANLTPRDKVSIIYSGSPKLNDILKKNRLFILKEASLKDFVFREKVKGQEVKIDQEKILLTIKKK